MHIWMEHRDAGTSIGASTEDSPRCCQHRAHPSLGAVASGLIMKEKVQPVSPTFTAAEFQPPTLDGATCLRDRAPVYSGSSQSPLTFPWGTPSSVCDTPDTRHAGHVVPGRVIAQHRGSRSRVPRSLHLSLDTVNSEPQPGPTVQPTCTGWWPGRVSRLPWLRALPGHCRNPGTVRSQNHNRTSPPGGCALGSSQQRGGAHTLTH